MAVRAKQGTKTARAKKPAAKGVLKKELKKAGGRRKPHTDPLLDGRAPVMGTRRKRAAKKAPVPPNKTETTANRRAKAYSVGIAQGGITGGKRLGKRTHSVGQKGRNPGRG